MMVHHRYCLFGEQSLATSGRTSTSQEELCTNKVWIVSYLVTLQKLQLSTSCRNGYSTSSRGTNSNQAQVDAFRVYDSVYEFIASLKDANSERVHFSDLFERVNSSVRNCVIKHAQELRDIIQVLERKNCVLYDPTSGI